MHRINQECNISLQKCLLFSPKVTSLAKLKKNICSNVKLSNALAETHSCGSAWLPWLPDRQRQTTQAPSNFPSDNDSSLGCRNFKMYFMHSVLKPGILFLLISMISVLSQFLNLAFILVILCQIILFCCTGYVSKYSFLLIWY